MVDWASPETCITCGIVFCMEKHYQQNLLSSRDKGQALPFYCPSGHRMYYTGKSDKEKLQEAQAELSRVRQQWSEAEDAHEAEVARMRKRSSAGTCPCCNRTFSNMAQHMRHMHPGYTGQGSFAHVDALAKKSNVVKLKRPVGRPRKRSAVG